MKSLGKVVGIGETVLDVLFRNGKPLRAVPGGSVFNGMVSLSRCEVPVLFISELGNDSVGSLLRSFMESNGLSTDYVRFFDNGLSPVSFAMLDKNGEAHYHFHKHFPPKRPSLSFPEICKTDIVMFGSYFAVDPELRPSVRALLQEAQLQEAIIYYDINFRRAHLGERSDLLPHFLENFKMATLVRCSNEDLSLLFPRQPVEEIYARYFLPARKPLIVTQGVNDIRLLTSSGEKTYPVSAVKPVSAIGAGDNFNAGLVLGIMRSGLTTTDLATLPGGKWNHLICCAQLFATEVCLSLENYVSG